MIKRFLNKRSVNVKEPFSVVKIYPETHQQRRIGNSIARHSPKSKMSSFHN